ncbi:hypothetical protein BJ322DRAFT_1144525 [Thelephora terrestris]|uniref:Pyridoxamine 5'-phosphate oxidase putative domain-containing protein n=1 Tax=Thelephora terrestris TaxID=56493 RepID=A0A9P6HBE3_9AGAM|nr:hypothetical protein BJ322DRAFT_1144525 [Thelephora terrestris]
MPEFFESIPDHLIPWLLDQHVFWVASAPLSQDGHVNLSPKGLKGSFRVVNSNEVWYEDLMGSGIETVSHVRENGRITLLFCALSGPPRIARLFGKAIVHEFGTPEYNTFIDPATRQPSSRSVIFVRVWKVGTSCGWGVPLFEFKGQRTTHPRWAVQTQNRDFDFETKKGGPLEVKEDEYPEKGIRFYQALVNQKSLDGLPGLLVAFKTPLTSLVKERLQPITQQSTLSKVRKEKKGEECESGCGPAGTEDADMSAMANYYLRKAEDMRYILLAFIFGLVVATYLPPTAKMIGSDLIRMLT